MLKRLFFTPLGYLVLIAAGRDLVYCNWDEPECMPKLEKVSKCFEGEGTLQEEKVLFEVERQLSAYFSGHLQEFQIPLSFSGSSFQKNVWSEIVKIPFGKTLTYRELAEKIGKLGAIRAVASACGKNPLAIVIPCHRVVSTKGLGGYTGGIIKKQNLLQLEKNDINILVEK